mgnify:CR=1 FL=1
MKIRKVFAVALIAAICLSLYFVYAPASAEDLALTAQDGLCVHHPEHTAECGYYVEAGEAACAHVHDAACSYVEPVEGQPCTHVHDAACGYVEAREAVPCDQGCTDLDGDSVIDHVAGCAYQPAEAGQPCTHVHDETCGYVEPVAGQPCTHVHDEFCGSTALVETGVCVYAQAGCPYCVVDWQWSDPQGFLTQEADGSWSMDIPGVSASNPVSASALQSFLPTEIATRMDNDTMPALAIACDLTAIPADGATSGDYLLQAYLADSTYALTDAAAPLQVTLRLGGAETYALEMPSGDPPYPGHIVTGVSPAGTTINLFDYWLVEQTTEDNQNPSTDANDPSTWLVNIGINDGHVLQFSRESNAPSKGLWNVYTDSRAPRTDIVYRELVNGYPRLNVDANEVTDSVIQTRDGNESLNYLFDPNIEHTGKQSFRDVKGLLQVDKDGYYYYNSQENYAVYYAEDNAFTLYEHPGVKAGGKSPNGQFFPFNKATQPATDGFMNGVTSTDTSINHYFGMHMSTRFIQQFGGHVSAADSAEAVTYEFSGDDDVWIFIDGTLVADLGGIHDAASVKIDFSTGIITINDVEQAEKLGTLFGYRDNTLPDNTYHTLDFFYLERGNTDSNMKLRYNLVTIPESSVIKVDQVGDPVPDAEFSLYAANDPSKAIATGVTNNNGEFVFKDEEGFPITIADLYTKYGQYEGNQLILKETKTPDGYRTNGDIYLYFQKTANGEVLLLSDSIWDKGAYAMSKVTATINGRSIDLLALATGNQVEREVELKPEERPLMFAVVYQKQDDGTWLPVYGDPLNGWKVASDNTWNSVLMAARENPYIFELASSGAYQVEVSNLPGDIRTYYYVLEQNNKNDAKYTIAYYYTDASSLSGATEDNTWRISSDQGELDRVFSVNLYVSNIKNRLLVQKVDDEGTPINGAVFSLYRKEDVTVHQDGSFTIEDGATAYDTVETANLASPKIDGGGIFPTAGKVLENGEYYLVETDAPYGYKKSEKITHIVVEHTGVYADAGVADDGIEVLRGVGSIMRSMLQFAADDDVDTTLHDIKATLASGVTYQDGTIQWDQNDETIWDEASNQVLHLQFEKGNALLDYGAFNNQPRALVTDVGWSKLLVRQCKTHTGTNTGVKQDLKNQDITNLFSGTVTVRVTNERVGNLTISKEVEVISGSPDLENQSFTFSIYNQKGGTPISGTYDAIDKEGNTQKVNFDEEGNTTVVLKKGESLTILGLPYDSYYKVEEKLITGYNVSIVKNNGDKVESAIIEGSIPHSTSEDCADTLAFTNSYDGATRVQLSGSKIMEGRDLTTNDKFTFSLGVYDTATQDAVDHKKLVLPASVKTSVTPVGSTNQAQFIFDFITFHDKGTFTFAINEERPTNATAATNYVYDGIKYDPSTILAVVTVTLDNDTNKLVADVEYFLKGDYDERTELEKMTFTNTGAYDLTVAKQVTGEMGDRDKPFTFQISVPGMENKTLSYTGGTWEGAPADVQPPSGDSLALNEKGEATFTLSHGQTITIHGLPVGTKYTITEPGAQADGYTVTASGSPESVEMIQAGCNGTLNRATTVTFTNEKATAVPTGLRLDALPWLLALLCGLAGCTALCVTGKTRRRKGGCGRTHG